MCSTTVLVRALLESQGDTSKISCIKEVHGVKRDRWRPSSRRPQKREQDAPWSTRGQVRGQGPSRLVQNDVLRGREGLCPSRRRPCPLVCPLLDMRHLSSRRLWPRRRPGGKARRAISARKEQGRKDVRLQQRQKRARGRWRSNFAAPRTQRAQRAAVCT